MHKLSLLHYLKEDFQDVNIEELLRDDETDANSKRFESFLNETTVQRQTGNSKELTLEMPDAYINSLSYLEYIDLLCDLLRTNGDRLLNGLGTTAIDGLGKNISFSFHGNLLKGPLWARLCNRVGRNVFHLILTGLSSIHPKENPQANLKWAPNMKRGNWTDSALLKRNRMYYQVRTITNDVRILHKDIEYLMTQILGTPIVPGKVPKKARKLFYVIQNAKMREHFLNYKQMEATLLTQRPISVKVFDNCTKASEVLRFVLVAVHKMFKTDTFGSLDNMAKVTSAIVKFIMLYRSERFDVDALIHTLKIADVLWLGKTQKATSIQDLQLRTALFRKFLVFLLDYVVVNIVRTFWYVTENPTTVGGPNAFFPRRTWIKLTKVWLSEYIERYLWLVDRPEANEKTGALTNFGTLRLIPKKLDLRPLCIPRSQDFTKDLGNHIVRHKKDPIVWRSNDLTRPIRDILRYQQTKYHNFFPKTSLGCQTLSEIAQKILKYRSSQLHKNQRVYAVQFDMKHCYDNLSQSKIISCIELLFSIDMPMEEYYLRNVLSHSADRKVYRRNFNVITTRQNIEELDIFRNNEMKSRKDVVTDNYKLFKYTMSDILDLVRSQVIDSTVQIPENDYKYYKRTRGVFQGLPLLATLCDIVYNSLVDQVILRNKEEFKGDSLFLRLADDFMFFSTSKKDCEQVFANANSEEAQNYGAFVNKDKLKFLDSIDAEAVTYFVGLKVDTTTMSIKSAPMTKIRIPSSIRRSLKATLKHHLRYLAQHLPEYLINLDFVTLEAALDNLQNLFRPIQVSVIKLLKEFQMTPDLLDVCELYTNHYVVCVSERWHKINGNFQEKPTELIQKMGNEIMKVAESLIAKS